MRLYEAIRTYGFDRIDLHVRVIEKTVDDERVTGGRPKRSRLQHLHYFLTTRFRKLFPRPVFHSGNETYRSQCLHSSGLAKELNDGDWDMAVLHWLGDKTMSIEEIGSLRVPYAWHLHDMWLFSGADHTSVDQRYLHGYSRQSRPSHESGPDINREVYERKLRHWRVPRLLITPSTWMAHESQLSPLTRGWPTITIPNPLDTDYWKPMDAVSARKQLNIPPDATVFLFGANSGAHAWHKGGDVFFAALEHMGELLRYAGLTERAHVLLFGKPGGVPESLPFPHTHLGPIDDERLLVAYGAASVVAVPSRVDNFPSVATEAHSCGRPVVASRIGGLVDIVDDGVTGKLVPPDSPKELAEALVWAVSDLGRNKDLGEAARERALRLWGIETVAKQYVKALLESLSQ